MNPSRPDLYSEIADSLVLPRHLMTGFMDAFAIGGWTYDLTLQRIDMHSSALDKRNVARSLAIGGDDVSASMSVFRTWLETCAEGDSTAVTFAKRGDPVAIRVFCTSRSDTAVRGVLQDCTPATLGAEGDQRFRLALKGAAHGIALVGLDGGWLQVNDAICNMLHYTEDELVKLTFQDITHPDDLETDLDYLLECIEGKRNAYQMEKRYFRRDGEIIWVHLAVAILRAENGTPLYFISQIQDITTQKQAAEELVAARDEAKRASAAKGAFLASMSHEIRTPMTGVMGMLDILQESGVTAEQLNLIRTARNSADMLLAIINDVLDMAKLEAGKVEIACADFDAEAVMRMVCDMMAVRAGDKGLRFNVVLPLSTRTWLKGDADRIAQILFNLLGNAVKFTDEGEVRFAAQTRSTDAGLDFIVSISDTGPGIPADLLQTVFGEFEQIHQHGARHPGGTGLGLSIVSRLVDAMKGSIAVESEVGKGSTFTVTLPLEQGSEPERDRTGKAEGIASLENRKVLVVEDNEVNRRIIASVLGSAGIEASYAGDGAEALEKLREESFDVILMDMQMPVMDGLTATRELRRMGITTPVLGLTANAMSHDRKACLEAGMNDHIAKPFRPADIFAGLIKTLR